MFRHNQKRLTKSVASCPEKERRRRRRTRVIETLENRIVLASPDPLELSAVSAQQVSIFRGTSLQSRLGSDVADAGDFNGDGFDDLLVSAPGASPNFRPGAGEVYVIFGGSDVANLPTDLSQLSPSQGLRLIGAESGDAFGRSVASAGDVNGDGLADLVIGAPRTIETVSRSRDNPPNPPQLDSSGAAYLIYGRESSSSATLDMQSLSLNDGRGFTSTGAFGYSVSGAGDVNADGFDDFIVGSPGDDLHGLGNQGTATVIFGARDFSISTLDFYFLLGTDDDGFLGTSVAGGGDVNGDGYADIVVGAPLANANAGRTFVRYGGPALPEVELLNAPDGVNYTELRGSISFDQDMQVIGEESGMSVGLADTNGDGLDDVLVGSPGFGFEILNFLDVGQTNLVFGDATPPSVLSLSQQNQVTGSVGGIYRGSEVMRRASTQASGVGDLNSDGFDDFVITVPASGDTNEVYLIYGGVQSYSSVIRLGDLSNPDALRVRGEGLSDRLGESAGGGGDFNGDGFADLLLGAPNSGTNSLVNNGAGYVVYGDDFLDSVSIRGNASANSLAGTSAAESIVAGSGDDTISTGGGADLVFTGQGADVIQVPDLQFQRIDGGPDAASLELTGAGLSLSLPDYVGTRLRQIDLIDIRGTGANAIEVDPASVLAMSSATNQTYYDFSCAAFATCLRDSNVLIIRQDGDDTVTRTGAWNYVGNSVFPNLDGASFDFYLAGESLLAVEVPAAPLPTVTLSANPIQFSEAGGTSTVIATLSTATTQAVSVNLAYSGSAVAGDYSASGNQITIPAGQTTGSVTLTATQDTVTEGNETVVVDITSVVNADELNQQQVTTTIIDDDGVPSVTLSANPISFSEANGTSTVTATLSNATTQAVTVNLAYSGSAVAGDYSASGNQITIPAGQTTGSITLTATQDSISEGNETVVVDITSVVNADELNQQQVTTTIVDDDGVPSVTLSANPTNFSEAAGTSTVTATLSNPTTQAVTVNLAYSGSAVAGDYSASGNQITIPAGQTTGSVTLTATQDTVTEGNETVVVDITSVVNADELNQQQVTTTIIGDDGVPSVTLSANPISFSEANGTSTVTATLSNATTQAVTVNLAYSGSAVAGDYSASGNQITIPAGQTTGSITLTATQDSISEGNETVVVDITSVVNADELNQQQVTTTIVDDDGVPSVTLSANPTNFSEAAGTSTVTATLSNPTTQAVTVNLAYSGSAVAGDYSVSGNQITIPAGQTTGSVTLTATQDTVTEGNETVVVDITSVVNANELNQQQVTTTIVDDDGVPSVTLSANPTNFSEAAGTSTVTATLSNPTTQAVTVNLAYSGSAVAGDYSASGNQITIPAGQTTGSVTLTATQDSITEGNETVVVDITSVVNANELNQQQVTTTIVDDDGVPSVTLSVNPTSFSEAGGTSIVTATLSNATTQAVKVNLAYSGSAISGDYSASGNQITIPAGQTTGSVTLTATQDTVTEGNETVVVDITSVVNANELNQQQVTTTIVDDDGVPSVTLSANPTNFSEAAGTSTVTATLSNPTTQAVTVNLAYSGSAVSGDYSASGNQITIPAGQTTGSVTLTATQDSIVEGDETVLVDVSSVANANELNEQQVTLTILDDETPLSGQIDSLDVAYGDLDGDGDVDAFFANAALGEDGYIGAGNQIWLNDGSGQFTELAPSLGDEISTAVRLADFDSDGDLDAFVVNSGAPEELWLNDGSATFEDSGLRLGGNGRSGQLTIGDIDSDGDLDAVVGGVDRPVELYINQGGDQGGSAGDFLRSTQDISQGRPSAPALADVDGDDDLDLVIGKESGQAVEIWVNQGGDQGGTSGTFLDSGIRITSGEQTPNLEREDLLADGDELITRDNVQNLLWLDLTVTGGQTPSQITARLQEGGDLEGWRFATNEELFGLYAAVGLPNVGGRSFANTAPLNQLMDHWGSFGSSGFIVRWSQPITVGAQGGFFVSDLAVLADGASNVTSPIATVPHIRGSRRGGALVRSAPEKQLVSISVADLNGDHSDDFLLSRSGGLTEQFWINQTVGNVPDFSLANELELSESLDASLGDIDGDGDVDLLFAELDAADPELLSPAANRVFWNQGGRQLGVEGMFIDSGLLIGNEITFASELVDLDNDGDLDAIFGNRGLNTTWLNDLETGLVTGVVFSDEDGDGLRNAGEMGIPDWAIVLQGITSDGIPVELEATTMDDDPMTPDVDESGRYLFDHLPRGNYTVSQQLPDGWIQTHPVDTFDLNFESLAFAPDVDFGNTYVGFDFGDAPESYGTISQEPQDIESTNSIQLLGRRIYDWPRGRPRFDGPVFTITQAIDPNDYVRITASGSVDYAFDGGSRTNAAGVGLSPTNLGQSTTVTDPFGRELVNAAPVIWAEGLGAVSLFEPSAEYGLGSSNPPEEIETVRRVGDLFGFPEFEGIPAGTLFRLLVADSNTGNSGAYQIQFEFFAAELSPRHLATGPQLGETRDAEEDGQPSPLADGDGSDEDGVMFGNIIAGHSLAGVNVDVRDADGAVVNAWIDFDANGVFDAGEQILKDSPVIEGLQTLNYEIPAQVSIGNTIARVRVSTDQGISPFGAADDGEIEDYLVSIKSPSPELSEIVINAGSSQRSRVSELKIEFDRQIDAPPEAFGVRNLDTDELIDNTSVEIGVEDGQSVVSISFLPGPSVDTHASGRHSLADGNYRIELLIELIEDKVTGGAMGDVENSPYLSDTFFRLLGDSDGDRDVDGQDYGRFGLSFLKSIGDPGYNDIYDSDGDGDVDGQDYGRFGQRFLTQLRFPSSE